MKFPSFFKSVCMAAAVTALSVSGVPAQEVDYNEDQYNAYTEAINESDPLAKEQKIIAFVKENPSLSLVTYALNNYVQLMDRYRKEGQSDRVFEAGEKLLELRPDNIGAQFMTAEAAYALKKYDKAVEYGEEVYASNPTTGFAYLLAISHQQLGNEGKFIDYGTKVVNETDPAEYTPGHFQILTGLRAHYARQKRWQEASKFAARILEGFEKANIPEGWDEYIRGEKTVSYASMGQAAYQKDHWSGVISNYQNVLRNARQGDLRAEAYYYIGVAHWKLSRLDPAMEAFARGSGQRGPLSDACQKYLETLYKSTHNGSLAGLEEFKARVSG